MRRWIGTLLAALLVVVPLLAQDKGADEKGNDRATQLKNIQTDYRKAVPDAQKALRAAKTPEERDAVFAKLNKEFAPRIIKLVDAKPKDNLSFQALMFAIQALPKVDGKVYDLLTDNWATDPQIKGLCRQMVPMPDESAEKLLRKVSEENKDKESRALATFALANMSKGKSEEQSNVKAA
ncbi:MAG TPA: hypothetical protein VMF69_28055, partial [Gemmataceae bacterium]|nr:hypothetical protein [Gemmataceae bacterium]